jgi:hypothetical protein
VPCQSAGLASDRATERAPFRRICPTLKSQRVFGSSPSARGVLPIRERDRIVERPFPSAISRHAAA